MLLRQLCSAAAAAAEDAENSASSAASSSSDHHSPNSGATSASCSPDDSSVFLSSVPSLPSAISTSSSATAAAVSLLSSFTSKSSSPVALAISSSSLILYCASETEIAVYDLANHSGISSFAPPLGAGAVKSVAVTSDGRFVTGHQDCRIRVWKREGTSGDRYKLIAALPTAADRLLRLPIPSNYVAVRRHRRVLWIEHADAVSAVVANGELLYSVSWDKTLKIWDSSTLRCVESLCAHDDAVNAVAVSPDGTVYTGSAEGRIRIWSANGDERRRKHALMATLDRHKSAVNALAIGGGGAVNILYSGGSDKTVIVWEREDSAGEMSAVGALRGHVRAVLAVTCAGDLLFSGSVDRTVRIWRRGLGGRDHTCLGVIDGLAGGVRSLVAVQMNRKEPNRTDQVEEDEYRVCSGSLDGEVRVWQVRVSTSKGSESNKKEKW